MYFYIEIKNGIEYFIIENEVVMCCISLFGGYVLLFIFKRDNWDWLWVSLFVFLNGECFICGGVLVCWFWFSDDYG